MACFAPLFAFQSLTEGAGGKRAVVFKRPSGYAYVPVTLPCGGCDGCRLERSRQWAVRCMHEASLYTQNCMMTLTYDDEHLPHGGSLDREAFPLFMKRLRKEVYDGAFRGVDKVRYFHCGEYGARFGRPHYHALMFGLDFADKVPWALREGYPVWRSARLEKLWPNGQSELGSVTFESAAYVARYVMKKVMGAAALEHYRVVDLESGEVVDREPEYTTMSRRPGIGKAWFDKFKDDVYPSDEVIVRGHECRPPRFYDTLYELVDGPGALEVSRARARARCKEDSTPERLADREKCLQARLQRAERVLE